MSDKISGEPQVGSQLDGSAGLVELQRRRRLIENKLQEMQGNAELGLWVQAGDCAGEVEVMSMELFDWLKEPNKRITG